MPRVRARDEAYTRIEAARDEHRKALREAAIAMAAEQAAKHEAEARAREAAEAEERAALAAAEGGVVKGDGEEGSA